MAIKILVTETQEVISLSMDTDPTDSLLSNYANNSEFKTLSQGDEDKAEYEMNQGDADWWVDALSNLNKAHALEEEYSDKYTKELVAEVLNNYYELGELGDDGINKINALNGYFKNEGTTYHELSKVKFIDAADGFEPQDDGSYHFWITATVSDVFTLTGNLDAWGDHQFTKESVGLTLKGRYKPNEGLEIIYGSSAANLSHYNSSFMSVDEAFTYVYDIAEHSKTEDGLNLEEACKKLLDAKIAQQ